MNIIAFDSHKRYSQVCVQSQEGKIVCEGRVEHSKGSICKFLTDFDEGSPVALETVGNWYWIVDEIEAAGMLPRLVHAHKAKLMMGSVNKTDKLDARGLNRLQQVGTLPEVWIPSAEIRDKRELARTRMIFGRERTRLKNRIHSVFDKYGLSGEFNGISDIFGSKGKSVMGQVVSQLPPETERMTSLLLEQLDVTCGHIAMIEKRMKEVFRETEEVKRLMSIPGIGFILAVVIAGEIGDIERFSGPSRLASYSGTVPRVHSSGGKTRYGKLRNDVNHYLKWAYSEAGNSTAVNHKRLPERHTSRLYKRIRDKKGHAVAVGAVARHLAEASYWVLKKDEDYREPKRKGDSQKAV